MRRSLICCVVLFVAAAPLRAEALPKVLQETWDAAYLEWAKCGSFHSTLVGLERDGKKFFRASLMMDLRIRRYNAVVPLRMETSNDETAAGQVMALTMTQFLDKGSLTQTGLVDGKELVVSIKGQEETRRVPWDATVLSMRKQESIFRDRAVKPGDQFEYKTYELSLHMPVGVRIVVKDWEETDLLVAGKEGGKAKAERVKKKLLRVEATPEKVKVGGTDVELPRLVSWLDEERQVVRSAMEMPGLGTITMYRTTKAIAEEEGAAPELLPDLGLNTLIALNKPIRKPHDAAVVVYRITVKGDAEPATTFARDARQQPSDVKPPAFTLTVRTAKTPEETTEGKEAAEEYRKSSYFIDSDDAKVRELAAEAVGREPEAWRKGQRIEKWVHDHMTGSSAVGFLPASQIARGLKGDCRQHAMLTAALCRAAGVPARTAVGLVYVNDPDRGPVLGFHMWTEVWARGQWLGLDATLGRGGIGAAHLKVADASWHNTQTLAPLLPVTRVMGRLAVEVLRIEEKD